MFAIKVLTNLVVGTEIEVVSLMWEASNLKSIFFFPLSVNPFLALDLVFFCAVKQLLCSAQSMALCSCSESFSMQ